jgi:hypothetical protein
MKRHAPLLGLLAALALPGSAFALREIIVGNQPIGAEHGYDKEVLDAVNVPERVVLSEGGLDGELEVYFRGGPKAVNQAFRRFAAIPAAEREIVLRPGPTRPFAFGKQSFPYDWVLHVPGTRGARGAGVPARGPVRLTVYVPNPNPPAPADPKAVRRWIADLASDDFKTRERAAKELDDVGPPAAALVRKALKAGPPAEARDRMEKLLAGMSRDLRADVLELPADIPVLGLDDLLARDRKRLADKDPKVRGHAAGQLFEYKAIADEVVPDLEKVLTTETDRNPLCGAAWAAPHLGAAAKPLLPALRKTAGSADKDVAQLSKDAIERIEAAKAEPVPEAEAKKRATIRKEIREFLAERAKGR